MGLCYCRAMDQKTIDRAAAVVAAIALIVGLSTIVWGRFDSGIRLATSGQYVVVSDVQPRSIAAQYGLRPGMIVTELQGVTLVKLPQYIWPDVTTEPTPDPETGEVPQTKPVGILPPTPTVVPIDPVALGSLLSTNPTQITAVDPAVLENAPPETYPMVQLYDDGMDGIRMTLPAYVLGVALLVLVGWWLASGRAGDNVRPLATSLAVATAVPFLVQPLDASWVLPLLGLGALLSAAAMVPLAAALLNRIDDEQDRRFAALAVMGCAVGAMVIGVVAATTQPWYGESATRWALVAAIPFIPGLGAAGPMRRKADPSMPTASGRLLESTEYAVIGATPALSLASVGSPGPYPLALWFIVIVLAGRFTIRPLARLATRAVLQRDLVVAATEAERARVAADIHDDALQELTLLVHRLDAAGDTEGADIARTVSDRLRAICGDLRLPILDDLGVGPALDWLVLRIERLAGGEVRLERADGTRPPADVELAFFRVAQEALANAVKHGKPPILVRYATTPGGASLSIDDAGPGIEPGAGEGADRAGHFGLLNMQQRAEAIGAILDVRRWPSGGTHVALDWRAR
jgi:signal transduction histidine kinase